MSTGAIDGEKGERYGRWWSGRPHPFLGVVSLLSVKDRQIINHQGVVLLAPVGTAWALGAVSGVLTKYVVVTIWFEIDQTMRFGFKGPHHI